MINLKTLRTNGELFTNGGTENVSSESATIRVLGAKRRSSDRYHRSHPVGDC